MVYVTVNTDVEVRLKDIDDYDLIDEIEARGYLIIADNTSVVCPTTDLYELYESYTLKRNDFEQKLKDLFYNQLGRIA